jgi:hypothetical protein
VFVTDEVSFVDGEFVLLATANVVLTIVEDAELLVVVADVLLLVDVAPLVAKYVTLAVDVVSLVGLYVVALAATVRAAVETVATSAAGKKKRGSVVVLLGPRPGRPRILPDPSGNSWPDTRRK